MKFFHISDLHIGKQLHRYNLLEEQRQILDQIVAYARKEQPDAILIAGDLYDTPVPSADAVSVFDRFLTDLNTMEPATTVCLIAGNHDSAKRIDYASSILEKHRVVIAGMPPASETEYVKRTKLSDEYGEIEIYLLPFVKPSYVKWLSPEEPLSYGEAVRKLLERETIDRSKRNVIVSHQFYTFSGEEPRTSESELHMIGGIENVDASVLEPFEYAALGHIHRKQRIGKECWRYSGTPLQYSVSEAEDVKVVTVVELKEKGTEPILRTLPLVPLRSVRKLTGTFEEILHAAGKEVCHDYVSITLTDDVEAYQPKERLEQVYDHILEIRIDNERTRKLLEFSEEEMESLHPYDAFVNFFLEMNGREMTEEEDEMLREMINREAEVME